MMYAAGTEHPLRAPCLRCLELVADGKLLAVTSARRYPRLAARDLVHVAICQEEGLTVVVSPDCGFDQVSEVGRIAPDDRGGDRVARVLTTVLRLAQRR